jgi:hypothetical protein
MAQQTTRPADVAQQGFSGSAQEIPHRAAMEQSFGMNFGGVKAYTDAPALKANEQLGANAYASGNQVAFSSSNPSQSLVAHELTHVVQHTGGKPGAEPSRKASDGSDGGIDTSGEAQANAVESAVAAGKPASSVMGSVHGGGGVARKQGPALNEEGSKFGMGLTFSKEGLEKSYQYKIWDGDASVPIPAVPGLNVKFESNVVARAAAGVNWKEKALTAALGVEGLVGIGLSYGNPAIAELYGVVEAKADGGFEYKKTDDEWELAGNIKLGANLAVGIALAGGLVEQRFEWGKVEVGTLTGLQWKNGKFDRGKVGWEWSKQMQDFFAAVKKVVDKAMSLAKMAADAAKAAVQKAKELGKKVINGVSAAADWVTSW